MAKTYLGVSKSIDDREKRLSKYVKEFESWYQELKLYWPQMDKNQEMYEFHKSEYSETDTDISLNTTFALVESMVSKMNETTLAVTIKAKGENDMQKFEEWVSSVLKDAIEDPDIAVLKGSFRKIKEKFTRGFLVVGNSAAAVEYCYSTQIIDGVKKVVADNPYVYTLPYKSVIFNPTRQFDNSDIYYIEKWVKMSDLESREYKEEKNKDGSVKKNGIYQNLAELKKSLEDEGKYHSDDAVSYLSGDKKITRKVEPVHILERWEGSKLCVIANKKVLIREEIDPFKIGRNNLLLAMNYAVEGRPYAYGEIDAVYKPVRAQDTIVNQSIEMVNRYLRPSLLVDPTSQIDLDQLMEIIESGGVTYGIPAAIGFVPSQVPPAQAFTQVDILQQAIERAARYSPYASGTPSAATDKTQGTKGGIQALQTASEPNFQVKIDAIEDSFMQPLGRIYLTMIANLMGDDELRYTLLKGETREWVKATKGILQGKATMQDLLTAEVITPDEAQGFLMTIDPITGQPVPIPGADKALVFDIDWVLDVRLDNQSAADKEAQTEKKIQLVQFGQSMGVQFNPEKTITRIAQEQGFEDIETLYLTDQEKQQQMMMQQQAQAAQAQQQAQSQQQDQQHQLKLQQLKAQADLMKAQVGAQPAPAPQPAPGMMMR